MNAFSSSSEDSDQTYEDELHLEEIDEQRYNFREIGQEFNDEFEEEFEESVEENIEEVIFHTSITL